MFKSNFFRAYGFWHCGEGVQTVLLMWYMAFHADLSPAEIGFYQALQLAPFLMFTAVGGSLTDRIGPRASFAMATGGFALILGIYGLLDPMVGFNGPMFAGYCLLSGLLSALSNPAIDCFIPEATARPTTENALLAATVHNVAKLTGNAMTLLLPVIGATGGFLVNGALMASSVMFLLLHQRGGVREPVPAREKSEHVLLRLRGHFRAHPVSLDILLGSAMLGLLVIGGSYVFTPLSVRNWFPQYQWLIAMAGIVSWISAIVAAGFAARMTPHITRPGRLALLIWSIGALNLMALVMLSGFGVVAYLAVMFLLGANGVGKALVYGHYLREAPASDRALLIGIDQTLFWGLATLGAMVLGWMVGKIGLGPTIVADAGAILLCVAILTLRGQLWRLGR